MKKFNAAKVVCKGISKIKKLTEAEKLGDETEKWGMKWKIESGKWKMENGKWKICWWELKIFVGLFSKKDYLLYN